MKRKATAGILAVILAAGIFTACSSNQPDSGAETTAAETTAAESEVKPTNEKYIPEMDFAFVDGIKLGMSIDEVKAVLGAPDKEEDKGEVKVLTYGKNEFTFSNFTDKKNKFSGEKAEGNKKNGLVVAQVNDDKLPCYNGMKVGMTRVEIIDGFCHDTYDNTPSEMRENGIKIIYGIKDFNALNEAGDKADDEYVFAYDSIGGEEDGCAFVYADYDFKNTGLIYMLIFSYDEGNHNVTDVMATLVDTN